MKFLNLLLLDTETQKCHYLYGDVKRLHLIIKLILSTW